MTERCLPSQVPKDGKNDENTSAVQFRPACRRRAWDVAS